jgi:hypothetical protein
MTMQSTTKATTNSPKTMAKAEAGIPQRYGGRFPRVTRGPHTSCVAITRSEPGARRRSADELMAELRGTRGLRPRIDRGHAGGLRAWLDDGIFERFGDLAPSAVQLSTGAWSTPSPIAASGRLRGALIAQLVRLLVAGAEVSEPFVDASEALTASGRDPNLCAVLEAMDAEECSKLASEVTAHYTVLVGALPRVPARWAPRCSVRQSVTLAGGGVLCRGTVDLALGTPGGTRACVCLVDITTSPLEDRHERVGDYLALLETLRTGEQPLRVATLSTAEGASVVHDVTPELLARAVDDLLSVLPAPLAA